MSTSLNSASKSSKGMEMARDTMSKETDFHDQLLAQALMVATPVMSPWRHRAGNFSNLVISLKRARSRVVLLWQMVHEHLRVAIEPIQITNKAGYLPCTILFP